MSQPNRNAHGKHKREDAAMKIVNAIHEHIAPSMDENDGGEILSWLLQFADSIEAEVHSEVDQGERR